MSDESIRRHWRSFDSLQPDQRDQLRRAWAEPVVVGLDLARGPDVSAAIINPARRGGKTAELEAKARELLASGSRVFEMSLTEGLRELTLSAGGDLVRGKGHDVTRTGKAVIAIDQLGVARAYPPC